MDFLLASLISGSRLAEHHSRLIASQLLLALHLLHSHGFVHSALDASAILLTSTLSLKLTAFEFSRPSFHSDIDFPCEPRTRACVAP
jgi:serine/threonine protein kinase